MTIKKFSRLNKKIYRNTNYDYYITNDNRLYCTQNPNSLIAENVKEVCDESCFINNDNQLFNIYSPTELIADNVKFAENNAYITLDNKTYIRIIVNTGSELR